MIVRIQKRNLPYVQIDKRPLENSNLSWKAKGLLAYLMSRPDDWTIHMTQLVQVSTDKRVALQAAMRELRAAGHAEVRQMRSADGKKATGSEWVIYEDPNLRSRFSESQENLSLSFSREPAKPATTKIEEEENKKEKNVPLDFAHPKLQSEFEAFQEHRRQMHKPLSEIARGRLVMKLAKMGTEKAIVALRRSIENGWTGVFEPRAADMKKSAPQMPYKTRQDKINELNRRKVTLMRQPQTEEVGRELVQIDIQLSKL